MLKSLFLTFAFTLISACAHATTRDAEGLTALHRAAGSGNVRLVETLLRDGADPLAMDSVMGVSVLHKAIYSGSAATVGLLLSRGALVDVQSPSNGNTPLHDAIYFRNGGDTSVVRTLLRFRPSLSVKNRAGLAPLDSARLLKAQDIVQLLEAYERSRQSTASRRLMESVRANRPAAVAEISAPASVLNESDDQGFTPLIWAGREGMLEIVKLLLAAGADPNQNDQWMRANVGHKAAFWGRAEVLKLLIPAGLEVNARGGYNGYTALHDAVAGSHVEAVRVLVEAGARADIAGHDGKTAEDLARAHRNPEVLRILGIR